MSPIHLRTEFRDSTAVGISPADRYRSHRQRGVSISDRGTYEPHECVLERRTVTAEKSVVDGSTVEKWLMLCAPSRTKITSTSTHSDLSVTPLVHAVGRCMRESVRQGRALRRRVYRPRLSLSKRVCRIRDPRYHASVSDRDNGLSDTDLSVSSPASVSRVPIVSIPFLSYL